MKLSNKDEPIKDRIIRYIKNFFEQQENYQKPARIGNFLSKNYVEYKSNGDRNKTLSIKKYLDKTKPYLKDIKNNLRKSDKLKIQLTITINSISSKDTGEERKVNSKINDMEIMMYDKADEVIQ